MELTQGYVVELLRPVLQYLAVDVQDVSKVEFTASDITVSGTDYRGKHVSMKVPYESVGGN